MKKGVKIFPTFQGKSIIRRSGTGYDLDSINVHRNSQTVGIVFSILLILSLSLNSTVSNYYAYGISYYAKSDGLVGLVNPPDTPSTPIFQWFYCCGSFWYQQFHADREKYDAILSTPYSSGPKSDGGDWEKSIFAFNLPTVIIGSKVPPGFVEARLHDFQHLISPEDTEYRPSYHLYATASLTDTMSPPPAIMSTLDYKYRGQLPGYIFAPIHSAIATPLEIPKDFTPLYRYSVCTDEFGKPGFFRGYTYTTDPMFIDRTDVHLYDKRPNNHPVKNPVDTSTMVPNDIGRGIVPSCTGCGLGDDLEEGEFSKEQLPRCWNDNFVQTTFVAPDLSPSTNKIQKYTKMYPLINISSINMSSPPKPMELSNTTPSGFSNISNAMIQENVNSISKNNANYSPVAENVSEQTLENKEILITFIATDQDQNDELSATIVSSPSSGTLGDINQQSGSVTYTPNEGFSGTDTFTYKVSDGKAESNVATVTIDVSESENNNTSDDIARESSSSEEGIIVTACEGTTPCPTERDDSVNNEDRTQEVAPSLNDSLPFENTNNSTGVDTSITTTIQENDVSLLNDFSSGMMSNGEDSKMESSNSSIIEGIQELGTKE